MPRTSNLLSLVLALAPSLAAFPLFEESDESVNDPAWFPWPESIAPGNFGRSEAAQITEDMFRDVVIACGPQDAPGASDDTIVLVYGPSIHRAVIAIPGLASDFAILRGAGPHGRDAIAITGSAGLRTVTVEDGATEFSVRWWIRSTFVDARRLRAADFDGDGDQDLFALDHLGTSISVALQVEPGQFALGPTFVGKGDSKYRDFVVLGSDDGEGPRFAMLDGDGLDFCVATPNSSSLTIVKTYPTSTVGDSIASLESGVGAKSDVAWITRDPELRDQWLLIADELSIDPNPVRLDAEGARAIVCEDLDADGDRDALISREAWTGGLAVFNNASAGELPFEERKSVEWSLVPDNVTPSPEPKQRAWPVVTDLDGNGRTDAFFACQAARRLGWTEVPVFTPFSFTETPTWRGMPSIQAAAYRNEPVGLVMSPTGTGVLRLSVKAATNFGADIQLHVVSWRQPNFTAPTESVATSVAAMPIPTGPGSTITMTPEIPILETGPYPFPAIYWIAIRFVQVDPATQRIVDAGQARLVAFAATVENTANGPSLDLLLSEPTTGETVEVGFEAGGFFSSAVQCGGVVPKASIPSFPPGVIPLGSSSSSGSSSN